MARYIDCEYLGEWRDKDVIISAVEPHISIED